MQPTDWRAAPRGLGTTRVVALAAALAVAALIAVPQLVGGTTGTGAPPASRPGLRATVAAGPAWLQELDRYRVGAGLAPASDDPALDAGIADHLAYMANTPASLRTGAYASEHTENPASPWYTPAGAREGAASDLFAGAVGWSPVQLVDGWLAAPFHAVGMLRPGLQQVAFASDPVTGDAGLDVASGLATEPPPSSPVLFPGPGTTTDLTRFAGEAPSPLQTCGWQGRAAGLPLIALLPSAPGPGLSATLTGPGGTATSAGGTLCVVDADTYVSTDAVYGPSGAAILRGANAVFVVPAGPLVTGTYTTTIDQPTAPEVRWSFTVVPPLAVTTTALPGAVTGAPYAAALRAGGGVGRDTWSVVGGALPPGLALGPSGVVTGRPRQPGTWSVTVQVADQGSPPETAPATWTLTVAAGTPAGGGPAALPAVGHTRPPQPTAVIGPTDVVGMAVPSGGDGYWLATANGGVFAFGGAPFLGSMGGQPLSAPVVAIVATPDGGGYWLVGADGGVFAFGDARFAGSLDGFVAAPVVGMAPTPGGGGYWLATADGGVFAFGDAVFAGSADSAPHPSPVVGVAATADGGGYWLAYADGGVVGFGDAAYHGSLGGAAGAGVTGIAATADGGGYWLVSAAGGVFAFGDARFAGSMGATPAGQTVVGMAADPATGGYWEAGSAGGVFAFGAPFVGAGTP